MVRRCVLVERPTEYRDLLARHGTREQVRFFLRQRGLSIEQVEGRHLRYEETRTHVLAAIPTDWSTATVDRSELDRFLFTSDDVVLALGQDGLVANLAKYLDGQPVIGVNPDRERYPGILVSHAPEATADLLADLTTGRAGLDERTMVVARLDDGQALHALNEVFVGHQTHQSARYALRVGDREEHQSSSGLIVSTGTGATGWAASVNRQRTDPLPLPEPSANHLAWFVREAWPSRTTGTTLTGGLLRPDASIRVTSELGDGAVVFGDGIESDRLHIEWGQCLTIEAAARTLNLVRS